MCHIFRQYGCLMGESVYKVLLHVRVAWRYSPWRFSLMVTTTLAAAALSFLLPVGTAKVTPTWQSDYRSAMQAATDQQKPVAVFIGKGEAGYNKLIGDGKGMGNESGQLLVEGYVCLYVDTDTAAGKTLAGQFQIDSGLVISSPGGKVQALRHNGPVTSTELNGYLTKYNHVTSVTSTEYRGVSASGGTVYTTGGTVYYGGGCANGNCGTVYYSGGCANGNCGTAGTAVPYTFSNCPNGKCPNVR